MAVAVHVRVSVGRRAAEKVQGILPPEAKQDGGDDEDPDDDTVADELIGYHGLEEKREQGEGEHLGEGDHIELLGVLQKLVVVVAGDGLHEDATESGDGKQNELDKTEGQEFREPVGGLRNGQRVMDASELGVALAPDEFGRVEGGDNVEEEDGAAFHGLEHEVGDGPDVPVGDAAGVVAVVESDAGHQDDDAPEGNLVQNVGDAQAGERGELRQGCFEAEDLVNGGELRGDKAASWRGSGEVLLAGQGGAFAAGAGRQRLHRHGE